MTEPTQTTASMADPDCSLCKGTGVLTYKETSDHCLCAKAKYQEHQTKVSEAKLRQIVRTAVFEALQATLPESNE